MSGQEVLSLNTIERAIDAHGDNCLKITPPKNEKNYSGTYFYQTRFSTDGVKHRSFKGIARDIPLAYGAEDPATLASKGVAKGSGRKTTLRTTRSRSGQFGRVAQKMAEMFFRKIDELKQDPAQAQLMEGQEVFGPMKFVKTRKSKNRGEPLKDPEIMLVVDYSTYPMTSGIAALRGKRKCQVLDYNKKTTITRKSATGDDLPPETVYAPAKVLVGDELREVDETNAHLFFTANSIIREMVYGFDSTTIGTAVSLRYQVYRIVLEHVEPPLDGSYRECDDDGDFEAATTETTTTSVTSPEPEGEVDAGALSDITSNALGGEAELPNEEETED